MIAWNHPRRMATMIEKYVGSVGGARWRCFVAVMALIASVVSGSTLAQDMVRSTDVSTAAGSPIDHSIDQPGGTKKWTVELDLSWLPDAQDGTPLAFILGLFLMTLINEDMACIFAGLLLAVGKGGFLAATFACFLGILLGDLAWFFAGRYIGRSVLNYPPAKWLVGKHDIEVAEKWFSKRGAVLLLLSRFLPGSRTPVFLSAGMLRVNAWRALAYFAIASALWTPLLIGLAALFGKPLLQGFEAYRDYALLVVLGVAVVFWLILKALVKLSRRSSESAAAE